MSETEKGVRVIPLRPVSSPLPASPETVPPQDAELPRVEESKAPAEEPLKQVSAEPVDQPAMDHRTEWMYTFSRLQKYSPTHPDYFIREGFLTDEECDSIIGLAQPMTAARSQLNWGNDKEFNRDTDIYWLSASAATYDLFTKVAEYVAEMNETKFNFELFGYLRPMQLGRYGVGQGYDWHQDLGKFAPSRRKLSIGIQLSSGDDYAGGAFEFFRNGNYSAVCPRTRGTIAIFPSWMVHRVTPITSGERWSLVNWVEGPPFR
jgi:PKHD-type hydroxylase